MTTLHVVSHTHWDREWYRTFQQFRFCLVRLVDELLAILDADAEYRHFTLDGQTIVLDDYLAIRPEMEGRIQRLVQEGRLLVGPWYVLPDEFLEGPEAMVRNLLFGRRSCRRFTPEPQPMERIGYLPDPFGHIGQLPQIAAGFGMEAVCFWRGVGDMPTEVRWAAPDGTECLLLHLRDSYGNGAWLAVDEEGFLRDLAQVRDRLAPHSTTSHLLIMQGTDHMEPRADLPARLRAASERLAEGIVHSTLPAYLDAVRAELGAEGLVALRPLRGELRSPERAHLLPAVLSARMWIKQANARCEALLTRQAEPLAALAEALHPTGEVPDRGQPLRGFLRESWIWLLQNHPHDSICGCSVDQVHREMRTRFDWSEQLAAMVINHSLNSIARSLLPALDDGQSRIPDPESPILLLNPSPFARTDHARVRLPSTLAGPWQVADAAGEAVPCRVVERIEREHLNEWMSWEAFSTFLAGVMAGQGPNAGQFRIEAAEARREGTAVFLDIRISAAGGAPVSPEDDSAPLGHVLALLAEAPTERVHLRVTEDDGLDLDLLARDVPGLGYTWLRLVHGHLPSLQPAVPDPQSPVADASLTIENEFFRVQADPADGTLTIGDKATGLVLRGANRFVDGGDRGDEYTFCSPENDVLVDRPAGPPAIRRLEDALALTLEIALPYRIPCGLAQDDRSARSAEFVDLPIISHVTLTPGIRRIEFETVVHNGAKDHRLRVLFPTPIRTDRSWAEGHFDVVERPLSLPQSTADWAEQPVGTHPQLTFVDVSDGRLGVLLANRGLPEYEALQQDSVPGVTLALTLLRCVGWLSRGDLCTRSGHAGPALPTPEAQCPGRHVFHYALVPHAGNYLTAYREAHAFNAPLQAIVAPPYPGPLPPASSFLEISPAAVVLSALKPPEEGEGLIVRLYNSAAVPVQARLRLWRPFHQAALVRTDESVTLRHLASGTDTVAWPLRAREIATLRIHFREPR